MSVDFDDDEELLCGASGPLPFSGALPYRCTEPAGHPGAHIAVIDGETVDSWPRTSEQEQR